MRFSSLFQHPAPQPKTGEARAGAEAAAPSPDADALASELPEDLDARVRLVGEWQLFEG